MWCTLREVKGMTPAKFYILLALRQGRKYAYQLMKETGIGCGTTFRVCRQMIDEGLIRVSDDQASDDKRRIYYEVTPNGILWQNEELERINRLLKGS